MLGSVRAKAEWLSYSTIPHDEGAFTLSTFAAEGHLHFKAANEIP
jgi:hypothetical protein